MGKYMKTLIFIFTLIAIQSTAQVPEIKWWYDLNDNSYGQSALADFDHDGKFEVVFGCYRNDSMVYALNLDDGSLLWKYNTSDWQEGCNDTAPLIYDVDGDGKLDVIVASSCNPYTYCFDGATGEVKWKTLTRGSDSPPTIADIDDDGKLEILHGQFGGYVICMNASDGIKKWDLKVDTNSWIQTAPTIVDLDGDGKLDFVVASWEFNEEDNQSKVYAYRGYDQEIMWTFDLEDVVYHGTAVVDLDSDGIDDLVIGDYEGNLFALNSADGSLKWRFKAISYISSPVVVGDLDGDGECELVFSSYYRYYALKGDGSVMWEYDIPNIEQSFRGAALSDIDNDGLPDVIFGTTGGQVIALKGIDASVIWNLDLSAHIGKEFSIDHAPIVADFDADGILDVFIVGGFVEYPDWHSNYGRAYAISAGKGQGPDWTMFQNNIHRTSSICPKPTSITESVQISTIISPNPATEYIEIAVDINPTVNRRVDEGFEVKIFNLLGECVIELADVQHLGDVGHLQRVDISHLPRGVYYLRIGSRTQMFVKM